MLAGWSTEWSVVGRKWGREGKDGGVEGMRKWVGKDRGGGM